MALADDDQALMLLGACLGLVTIPAAMAWRRRVFNNRHDIATELVSILYERMITLRACGEAFLCLLNVAGYFVRRAGKPLPFVPTLLGFLFQFEECAILYLMHRMAFVSYRYLVQRGDASENQVYYATTVKVGLAVGLAFSIPPLAAGLYGDNGLYFWFRDHMVELLAFWWFSFLMGITAIVLSVIILLTTSRRIKHARKFVLYGEHLPAHIAAQAAIGFLTENVFWGLPYWLRCVAFTYAAVTMTFAQRPRWCQLIDVACIAYRGVWVMLLYCPKDFVLVANRALRRAAARIARALAPAGAKAERANAEAWRDGMDGDEVQLMMLGRAKPLPFFTILPPPTLEGRRMFVTTFNCGECTLEMIVDDLGEWIPRDLPVYVIGVQECLILEQLKEAIRDYLGRELYVCWDEGIGSNVTSLGFHGYIGLIVLARAEDVRAGTFMMHESQRQRVARGKNLGVARAQNKGGVGLAFRYYDLTVGALCVHLASDSKGRSKLKKRLRDARDLLSMTSLTKERYKSMDLQNQQHITLFLGDLNFRLKRMSPKRTVDDLTHICRREKHERFAGRRDWRRIAYSRILTPGHRDALGTLDEDCAAYTASSSSLCGVSEQGEESTSLYRSEAEWGREKGVDDASSVRHTDTDSALEEVEEVEEVEEEGELREEKWEEEWVADAGHADGASSDEEEGGDESTALSSEPARKPRLSINLGREHSLTRVTWEEFLRSEELRRCMEAGDVFFNFSEGEIRFPPSYRRIRGHEGDCGDYTDPAVVHDAYSIYVKEKSLLKSLLRKGSSYSSTATSSSHSHSHSVLFSSATTTRPAASSRTVPAFSTYPSSGSDSSSDPPPRPAPARRISSGSELPSTASDDSSSILPKPPSMDTSVIEPPTLGKPAPSEGRTTRIPSYTDRILFHVMPDRRSRVWVEAYEACDAITCSDHNVNTGLRGLGCFRPIIEPRHHEEAESDDDCGWEEGGDDEEAGGSGAGAGGVPRGPVQQPLTVCSVQDAAFFKLEVTNVRADFGLGCERGFFPGSAAPEYVAVQCPMSYEDPYRDLRRPAYNTQICRQQSFLTQEPRINPFQYFSMVGWKDMERCGVSFVTCTRPEWGMRAGVYVRSGCTDLGCALLPLTGEDGVPIPFQEGLCVPTTRGGVQTGTLVCDVKLTQLAVPPKHQGPSFFG